MSVTLVLISQRGVRSVDEAFHTRVVALLPICTALLHTLCQYKYYNFRIFFLGHRNRQINETIDNYAIILFIN